MSPEEYIELQERFLEVRELASDAQQARLQELPPDLASQLKELLDADHSDLLERPLAKLQPAESKTADQQTSEQDLLLEAETETLGRMQPDLKPTSIGPYQILQQIGEGGHGIVYMAEQKAPIRRRVALKLIKPGMESKEILARFEAERQALAMMKHPSIANVLDAGTSDSGSPYFVMELVHGLPVDEFCRRNQMSLPETLELFQQVCDAVHHAHRKGIIHRDLKPANILVTIDSGKPLAKVIDFGIAKALHLSLTDRTMFTEYGQIVGTLEYMSPEQATMSQDMPDIRSDVYSLGVVLYVLLTGCPPISKQQLLRKGLFELGHVIEEYRPQTPSLRLTGNNTAQDWREFSDSDRRDWQRHLRGDLDWITMKALAKDPKLRYDGASELSQDLENFLTQRPVVARPPSRRYEISKWIRRHRMATALGLGVFACLLTSLAAISWAYVKTNDSLETVRSAKDLVITKAKELESALSETERQRKRADDNSQRLAARLQQEILSSAWTQALDGDAEESARQLQTIPASQRNYVWQLVNGVRQQIERPSMRSESRGPIRCSAVHENGKLFAVVTTESMLELWDLEASEIRAEIQLEPEIYSCLSFSDEGNRILLGAPGWVGLVDLESGQLGTTFAHQRGGTRDIAYNRQHDEWYVTTGSNHLLLLDADDLALSGDIQFEDRVEDISIGPTGTRLAIATVDGNALLVNLPLKGPPVKAIAKGSQLQDFYWTGDFLYACDLRGQPFRLNLQEQSIAPAFELLDEFNSGSKPYADIRFLDQDRMVTATSSGVIDVRNGEQTIPIRTFSQSVSEVHSMGNERGLIVRHFNGRINIITGASIAALESYAAQIVDLTDGVALANGPFAFTAHENGQIKKWNTELGREEKSLSLHTAPTLAIDVHEPSKRLATYGLDLKVQVSRVNDMQEIWSKPTFLGMRTLLFSNSGKILAAAPERSSGANHQEGTIDLWDASNGSTLARLEGHSNWVMQLAFTKDDQYLYSLSLDGTLRKWNTNSAEAVFTVDLQSESPVTHFAINEDARTILLGHEDGALSIRNADDGRFLRRDYVLESMVQGIILPAASNTAFVTAGESSVISCIDPNSLKVIAQLDPGVQTIKGIRSDREYTQLQILGTNGSSRIWTLPSTAKSENAASN